MNSFTQSSEGMPGFMYVFFVLFIGFFALIIISAIINGIKNAKAPILTSNAKVLMKRADVTHHHDTHGDAHTSTWHYITFELETGERIEFSVGSKWYGILKENDEGDLTYQGEWFKNFQRK